MITIKDMIVRKPTAAEKDVCKTWPIWTHEAAQFDWEYSQVEKCLILEGQVTITDRPASETSISFGPGDYVVFPKGLKCVWKIEKAVKKHYDFE